MAKLINLKDLLQAKEKIFKFVLEDPPAVLYYKAQVVFQEEGVPERQEKAERVERAERAEKAGEEVKNPKRLKFEDEGGR